MVLTDVQLALLRAGLSKLTERTSVISYVALALALFGVHDPQLALTCGVAVATVAGAGLFLINDRAVAVWLTCAPATSSTPSIAAQVVQTVTVSLQKETSMNLSTIAKEIQLIAQVLPLVTVFVQQAESTMVASTGSQKLATVEASINMYLDKVNADAQTIAAVQSQLDPIVSSLVAGFKAGGFFASSAPGATDA